METNNKEGKTEKSFKNFGRKVDDFMVELNDATERLRVEFKQKYDELRAAAEKVKKESETNERWKEVEESLKKASDELGNAFRAAFKKRDPDEPTKQ